MNTQYTTTDLALATFLSIKGFEITNIKNGARRKTFVFDSSSQLKEIVETFNFAKKDTPELMVDARALFNAYRDLKVKVHNVPIV